MGEVMSPHKEYNKLLYRSTKTDCHKHCNNVQVYARAYISNQCVHACIVTAPSTAWGSVRICGYYSRATLIYSLTLYMQLLFEGGYCNYDIPADTF